MSAYIAIGAVAGIVVILVIIISVCCMSSGKTKTEADILPAETFEAYENPIWKKTEVEHRESLESLANIAQSMKVYNFMELQYATDDFSPGSQIKGSVYRGKMNGDLTAIKKMKRDVSKEINSLSKINHFNLIRVLGVCFNEGRWYLIYEYASNGPLNDWIFSNNTNQKFLSWTQRMQIVLDVARGLNYIHSYNSPPYVYKDFKSSRVLLDIEFRAKISYFSSARSAEGQKEKIASEQVYLSPEYREKGQLSTKLDVYAFGMLMLEVLTGKKVANLCERLDGNVSDVFVGVFDETKGKDRLKSLMDPSLKGNYPSESAISVARLIELCLNKDPSSRPDMEEIVKSLSKVLSTSMTWESSL
ncbi:lysM domain receptor-like kinase 4 [Chenopodium quinoa]|uniref:Protein kinase domain-containing protein n=1 Tax=Chenopodium quinoa TaxID=63459 RepID=A0A803L840_CHEQI|nr:lysM domain receptor-like kinase 4 [Chenopodium quinoa]